MYSVKAFNKSKLFNYSNCHNFYALITSHSLRDFAVFTYSGP